VDAHTKAALNEAYRGGAACDPAADDRDVDPAVEVAVRARRCRVIEPERIQDVER
jgi:hypothetical protein